MSEMRECPNPRCRSADREHDLWAAASDAAPGDWSTGCAACGMSGPVMPSRESAVDAWNEYPRVAPPARPTLDDPGGCEVGVVPLKLAIDIGGVLSKYPDRFLRLAVAMHASPDIRVHVITDMDDRECSLETLRANGFGFIPPERVHNADYSAHGEMCKAVIVRDLGIDILIDDFAGYTAWDSTFGPAPIRCLVQPDPFRPYWAEGWKTGDDHQFGRRVYTPPGREEAADA